MRSIKNLNLAKKISSKNLKIYLFSNIKQSDFKII